MAKRQDKTSGEVQLEDNNKESKVKVINIVQLIDGTSRNFGERTRLLSDKIINQNGFNIKFNLVTGHQFNYSFEITEDNKELLLEMAAFGVDAKVKASTAGVPLDKLQDLILSKLKDIENGNFVTRASGELTGGLTQLQQAYARVNGLDITKPEDVNKLQAIFAAYSKEEKTDLQKQRKIQIEIAKLRLEALTELGEE